jgi:hypothetical protein
VAARLHLPARHPHRLRGAFGAVIILAKSVLDEWRAAIFTGNLLAASAMLAYFLKGHRQLANRMTEAFSDED